MIQFFSFFAASKLVMLFPLSFYLEIPSYAFLIDSERIFSQRVSLFQKKKKKKKMFLRYLLKFSWLHLLVSIDRFKRELPGATP